MYEVLDFQHDEIPPLDDDYMIDFARELYDEWRYFKNARQELETILWPQCDRAYMCLRKLPDNDAMEWVDQSDLGETDVRDGVRFLAESVAMSLLPRDMTWMDPVPLNPDDQPLMNRVRDYLQCMHKKADTRGQYEKHLKQVFVRGTGAITWTWKKRIRRRVLAPADTLRKLAKVAKDNGVDVKLGDLQDEKVTEVVYSGWQARPVDMYDYLIDPNADLVTDDDVASIMLMYVSLDDLQNSTDAQGNPLYSNLDGIEPFTVNQIYGENPWRYESIRSMGINPIGVTNPTSKYVPVFVFHRMLRKFKDKQFVDTYFYLAFTKDTRTFRVIRADESPCRYGSKLVFVDTYDDWLNVAYGTGAVEKSLTAWEHKNVLSALTLQAQLASVFPAYNVIGGMLLDDRMLRLSPGSVNFISLKPSIGTKFMEPVPVPQNLQQVGELAQRWLGQKITGQMGAYGALLNDPSRTVTEAKTATQVNTESTSGSVGRDNLIERMCNRTLEPLLQTSLDAAKQWAEDENIFESPSGQGHELVKLTRDELQKVDRLVANGFHGLINKQNEIRELNEAIVAMSQAMSIPGMSPHLQVPLMETVFKLLARLGVENLDKYKGDPMQLLMSNPEIQAQIQQIIQQQVQQLVQQGAQQFAQEGIIAGAREMQGAPPIHAPMPAAGPPQGPPPGAAPPGHPPMQSPKQPGRVMTGQMPKPPGHPPQNPATGAPPVSAA